MRRVAGLALALGLHLLFFAVLVAQRSAAELPTGRADAGAIVWIAPPAAHATTGAAARREVPPVSSMPRAPAMRVIAVEAAPASPASAAPADDGLNVQAKPAPVTGDLSALDQRSIGAAIKATLAENVGSPPRKGLMRVRELGRFEQFGADVQEASVPDCDKGDALKLDPPVIPGTRVGLKGLLVLPHLAHAALTGRCR
jgi:hypothetical protein